MTKKKAKRMNLYVVKQNGYDLPGHGWRPYGGSFDMAVDMARTLARSSPQIFSFEKPAIIPVSPPNIPVDGDMPPDDSIIEEV